MPDLSTGVFNDPMDSRSREDSYESGVLDVADFLKDEKGLRLRLSDVRGDLFNRARK